MKKPKIITFKPGTVVELNTSRGVILEVECCGSNEFGYMTYLVMNFNGQTAYWKGQPKMKKLARNLRAYEHSMHNYYKKLLAAI